MASCAEAKMAPQDDPRSIENLKRIATKNTRKGEQNATKMPKKNLHRLTTDAQDGGDKI